MALSKKIYPPTRTRIPNVIRRGKKIMTSEIKMYFIASREHDSKIAILVSKKIDKRAVVRNKLRRRAREIIHSLLPRTKSSHDIVISFQKGAQNLSFQELKKKLNIFFKSL